MLVLGAGGHAIEVLDILIDVYRESEICFYDDTKKVEGTLLSKFRVINSWNCLPNPKMSFVLGVGGVDVRRDMALLGLKNGGVWKGIRGKSSTIGLFDVRIDATVDLMQGVKISSRVTIDKGTLVNRNTNIHHDVKIGQFCELSPSCQILGGVEIGDSVFVGAGAIILPKVKLGNHVVVGAGTIVTKDVGCRTTVVGNPGRCM